VKPPGKITAAPREGHNGLFAAEDGATPLALEEKAGLKPFYIGTRDELNAAEQANIIKAHAQLFGRRRQKDPTRILEEGFLKRAHRAMYDDVWSWAGDYRKSEKNIGVEWVRVPMESRLKVPGCRRLSRSASAAAAEEIDDCQQDDRAQEGNQ